MVHLRFLIPSVLTLQAILGAAHAQTCVPMDEAVAAGASRAPEVAAAEARLDAGEASLTEARALRRPQVSTFGRSQTGDTGLTSNRLENQAGLQVSQRIYDFGDSRLAIEQAEFDRVRLEYDVESQRSGAAYTVASAYLDALEARRLIAVISERQAYFARQQSAVESLFAQGSATRADRAQIAAQRAEAEADMLELQSSEERALARLGAYLDQRVEICEDDAPRRFAGDRLDDIHTVDEAIDIALAANPDIGALRSAVRSQDARRERERRSRLPVINLVGIASYVYDDTREDWEARDSLGVDVSIPLYTGNSLGARVDRENAQLIAQESDLRALQRQMREQAEISFRRSISLRAQLARRETVAESQQAYFEAIAGEFEFGLGTLPDLVQARLDFERAQLDVVSLEFALMRQQLDLLLLTDRLVTQRID